MGSKCFKFKVIQPHYNLFEMYISLPPALVANAIDMIPCT